MMLRVTDFVSAMKRGHRRHRRASERVEPNRRVPRRHRARHDRSRPARHAVRARAASSAKAVELVERSNAHRRRPQRAPRRARLAVSTLDIRTEDLDQRLKRFSGLLDELLAPPRPAPATSRAWSPKPAPKSAARHRRAVRGVRETAEHERRATPRPCARSTSRRPATPCATHKPPSASPEHGA